MDVKQYKDSIKQIVDATNNEFLLQNWEQQLKRDTNKKEELSVEEWALVEEGILDYNNGNVITLEEFISKNNVGFAGNYYKHC